MSKVVAIGGGRTPLQVLEEMAHNSIEEKWIKCIVIGIDQENTRCIAVSDEVRGTDLAYACSSLGSLFNQWDQEQ